MTDPVRFDFRALTAADAPALVQTAADVFGADWSEAFIRWKYFGNPAGPAYCECAELDGKAVAFFSNLPAVFKLDGGRHGVRGAQAVDAMVAEPVRRHGLFLKLAQAAFRRMDEEGVALTYVFASAAAQAGFISRLGFVLVGRVRRYVCVLDPAGLAAHGARRGPAAAGYRLLLRALAPSQRARARYEDDLVVRAVETVDERFDALWMAAAEKLAVAVVRDKAYLQWRYAQNPLRRYEILAAERGQALVGCAVLSIDSATRTGRVLELFNRPGEGAAGAALLAAVTARARQAGCLQLQAWMLPQHTATVRTLTAAGFRHWPVRAAPGFLRYSTAFIVRAHPARPRRTPPSCKIGISPWATTTFTSMRVLMYHEVVADRPQEAHAVSVVQFKAQMQWLRVSGYTVVALSQLLAAQRRGARLPRRAVALTFDDGYRDNYEQAWPVLQAYAYTATIFLVSGLMVQTSQWRPGGRGEAPLLTWAQAREMAAQGVSFGSHTVTHPDLATVGPGQADQELRVSRSDIEAQLGRPADLLAYPYSRFTQRVKQSLPGLGYQLACACPTGYVGATDNDLLELKRITVLADDTLEDFGRKVRGSLGRRLAWYRRVAGGWYHRWRSPNRTG